MNKPQAEPPNTNGDLLKYFFVLIIALLLFALWLTLNPKDAPEQDMGFSDLSVVNKTALVGVVSHVFYCRYVEADMGDHKTLVLLCEVIKRESNGNPLAKNPDSSASGLTQLIRSNVTACGKKLGKGLDPLLPSDNIECALLLLNGNKGIAHWDATGPY